MRKLSPSGSSSSGECGQLCASKDRGSSSPDTDSGCEMSVMVTYAREPRVRRPDTDSDTADTDTVDTDNTLARSSDSDGTAGESGGSRYEPVVNFFFISIIFLTVAWVALTLIRWFVKIF